MKSRWIAVTVVLSSLAIGGCGKAEHETASLPPLGPVVPVVTNQAALDTPFDQVFETQVELAREADAWERLVSQCTQRLGYKFVPGDDYQPRAMFYDFAMPYGLVDPRRASTLGYHDPLYFAGPTAPRWDGNPTLDAILHGGTAPTSGTSAAIPDGGCEGEATAKLGGAMPAKAVALADTSNADAGRDPRFKAAIAAWSRCMASSGYHYTYFLDPFGQYAGNGPRPTAEETAAAAADIHCKETTKAASIAAAVRIAYENQTLAENADLFKQFKAWRAKYDGNVDQVLATVPPPPNRYWLTDTGGRKIRDPNW